MSTRLEQAWARWTRSMGSNRKLWIGIAALTALVVVVGATVFIKSLHLGETTYRAKFAQAAGIAAGDGVTVAGIPVGTVTDTRLAENHVVVTMKIEDHVALGSETRAAIKLTTLLGSRYLELRPGGSGEIPGHTIALSHTEVPYDLQTALQSATTTFGQVDADRIAQSMTVLSQQLQGTPALVPEVLRNVQTLSTVIAQRRAQLGSLLTSTGEVTTLLENQQAELGSMFTQGRDVLREVISRQQAIQGLVASATTLVQQLEPIVVDDQPEIQRLLTNLTSMTQMMANHDDLLRNILQILPVPWRLFANALGSGQELTANAPEGALMDTFMCALSQRAKQMNLQPYYEDCK